MTLDTTDVAVGTEEESPVIRGLRTQIRDLEASLKSRPEREQVAAEVRSQLEREQAIAEQLIALGHPKGMLDTVASKVGEGEVNRDSVAQALTSIGYNLVPENDAANDSKVEAKATDNSALAEVSTLSAQISAAAQGEPADSTMAKIAGAKSNAELAAIMAEAGATKAYS
jgi:hypothetical protein